MYVPDHSFRDLLACVTFSQVSHLPDWWNSAHLMPINLVYFCLLLLVLEPQSCTGVCYICTQYS